MHSRLVTYSTARGGRRYIAPAADRRTGLPTVEAELFGALSRSGAVAGDDAGYPPHYSRASRTDRGVSALGQVVSMRMRVWDGVIDEINCHLPDDIRICDIRRVPPSFNAQKLCDGRLYSYTLPTFAFAPMCETVSLVYRLTESRRQEVYQLFQNYVGVHSFHSFSPKGDPDSQKMTRRVMSIDVAEPYLAHGLEFTTIWVKGASFVLSQIRRMVGMVVAVCRGAAAPDALPDALGYQRLCTPTAPGLGLVLRQAQYDSLAAAPWNVHGALTWSAEATAVARRQETLLLRHIHRTEADSGVTFDFVDKLLHNRVGLPVTSSSSYRSPLGYALLQTGRAWVAPLEPHRDEDS
ncbi:tRNA pseudouridine synthase A-like [Pollicipes pollicipes]|uniref:tRNA pseudouridine synthase A-like n=1 Tax=Pollicipes pollicipes TaxID=41117 RepID=UPI0018853E72|nr:tRNA pseudouridine synthase A-like [Pollicipes pollicipes]